MIFTVNKLFNVKAFYNKQFSHDCSLVISANRAGSREEGSESGGCESGLQLTNENERYLLKTRMLSAKCCARVVK